MKAAVYRKYGHLFRPAFGAGQHNHHQVKKQDQRGLPVLHAPF